LLRHNEYRKWIDIFQASEAGLINISRSYKKFGLQIQDNGDIQFMEWAPNAKSMSIFGEFNNWNRDQHYCKKNDFGCFTITLKANQDGTPCIEHRTRYKLQVEGPDGQKKDRNSAWAKWQNQINDGLFDCVFWNPPANEKYVWNYPNRVKPERDGSLRIYEGHVGMA
jgi:1,4-alpha-glucan branching enzyme